MDENRTDEAPMLLDLQLLRSDDYYSFQLRNFASRMRSASMSIPSNSIDSSENMPNLVGHTGPLRSERKTAFSPMSGPLYNVQRTENPFLPNRGAAAHKVVTRMTEKFPSFSIKGQSDSPDEDYASKNQHLLRSGQLGMCNDPYCTTCPSYYNSIASQKKISKTSVFDNYRFHSSLNGDTKGRARRLFSYLYSFLPGVMNPHTKFVQQWNKFFVISCLVAVFVDPLFFFPLSVKEDYKCIVWDRTMTTIIVFLRTMTDFVYFVHIFIQFRLAYIAPESKVVGAGEFVDHPTKIAQHYIRGCFFVDLLIAFPLPQIMILLVVPQFKGPSAANYAKNLLRASVLVQYIPRLYRIMPMLGGQSSSGFIFESAWANFIINLLTFVLSGHVVGSCWYLFGLQRVNQCLREACASFNTCEFMDCGHGDKINNFGSLEQNATWQKWINNANAINCFSDKSEFSFGIYQKAVNLTTEDHSIITRYVYSLFWGFQQISTLAGNQTPSYFVGEVLFTMSIIGLGLLLFALLIGHMQNFLQALGRRRLEMSLRRRDVEQWMSHRRLPEDLRRKVHQAERYNWAATRGVNEEELLDNLPEDLQREIRRHLCKFMKKVRIFALMEDPILDAICEKLRQKTYIKGSKIMCPGNLVEKMVFIVRGKLESSGDGELKQHLSEGDVCGEELLAWCLENCSVNKEGKRIRLPGHRLLSGRMVKCLTNVEAFVLRAADLEEVTILYARFLRSPRVQGAIRYVSPYWRGLAAARIQVAWRYRKRRLSRRDTSQSFHPSL